MRKIIMFNNLSLDGQFADAQGGVAWAKHDDGEMTRYVQRQRGNVGTYLFGKTTYQMFASFWPTPAGQAASPYFAKLLNESPKHVFSNTLKSTPWANTQLHPRATPTTLKKFKSSRGPDAMIFGSGALVRQLTTLGLIDEYQIVINPVALGAGRPLFSPLPGAVAFKLLGAKAFKNGTVLLRYRPAMLR